MRSTKKWYTIERKQTEDACVVCCVALAAEVNARGLLVVGILYEHVCVCVLAGLAPRERGTEYAIGEQKARGAVCVNREHYDGDNWHWSVRSVFILSETLIRRVVANYIGMEKMG